MELYVHSITLTILTIHGVISQDDEYWNNVLWEPIGPLNQIQDHHYVYGPEQSDIEYRPNIPMNQIIPSKPGKRALNRRRSGIKQEYRKIGKREKKPPVQIEDTIELLNSIQAETDPQQARQMKEFWKLVQLNENDPDKPSMRMHRNQFSSQDYLDSAELDSDLGILEEIYDQMDYLENVEPDANAHHSPRRLGQNVGANGPQYRYAKDFISRSADPLSDQQMVPAMQFDSSQSPASVSITILIPQGTPTGSVESLLNSDMSDSQYPSHRSYSLNRDYLPKDNSQTMSSQEEIVRVIPPESDLNCMDDHESYQNGERNYYLIPEEDIVFDEESSQFKLVPQH